MICETWLQIYQMVIVTESTPSRGCEDIVVEVAYNLST